MKKSLFLLLIAALMVSCGNKSNNTANRVDNDKPQASAVTFATKEYNQKSNLPNMAETEVDAEIPVAEGDNSVAKNINEKVFATVKSIVAQEGDNSSDYSTLFSNFVKSYEDFAKEYPDSPGGWEATVKGSVEYDSPQLLNIKIDAYTMTGGAHGLGTMTSLLFDPATGRELSLTDIVSDTAALSRMAEVKFRDKYDIPQGQSINSTGKMFVNDRFILPQNVFIEDDGLMLYYNPYEAAAYVEGSQEVELPYDEVRNLLKINIE